GRDRESVDAGGSREVATPQAAEVAEHPTADLVLLGQPEGKRHLDRAGEVLVAAERIGGKRIARANTRGREAAQAGAAKEEVVGRPDLLAPESQDVSAFGADPGKHGFKHRMRVSRVEAGR